jgi:hypothetical protein
MTGWQKSLATVLASLYFALMGITATCLFSENAASHGSGHHHQKTASHSALCLWACQGSPTVGLTAEADPGDRPGVTALHIMVGGTSLPPSAYDIVQSRAPPVG